MKYLYVGQSTVLRGEDVIGVFDLDNASAGKWTRVLLNQAEKRGSLENAAADLPRSFVLTKNGGVYLSQLNTATLKSRWDSEDWRF